MPQPSEAQRRLGRRLRALRQPPGGVPVPQKFVADALGASVPLVSSWESGKAVPPMERLEAYALLFADMPTSGENRGGLPDPASFSAETEGRRRELLKELVVLRQDTQREQDGPAPRVGPLGTRFWSFPEGAQVRILTTRMWPEVTSAIKYSSPWHPNYIEALHNADQDAAVELFGHVRAENPTADVRVLTVDQADRNDLTGEVILLGQSDSSFQRDVERVGLLDFFVRRLELPVATRLREGGDREFDWEFVVTCDEDGEPAYYSGGQQPPSVDTYRPVFLRDYGAPGHPRLLREGYPQLEYDVALVARKENQLNLAATVTICAGVFSRGTYGAVRALTDRALRAKNEEFLAEEYGLQDFWLLTRVPIFQTDSGAETVTPDLARPFNRLRSSAPASSDPESE